jgi:hypothetical protein
MKLYELFNMTSASKIFEDREEFIKTKFGSALEARASEDVKKPMTADEVLVELMKADPTAGKHLQFIVRMYLKKQFKLEDVLRLKDDISKFEKFKSKIENKDLNSYKELRDLYAAIEPFAVKDEPVSGKQAAKQIKAAGAEKIIDEPDFTVLHLKNEDAAKFYGKGTKWCTAAEQNCMFDTYNKQGNLYVIITKLDGKERKFQFHFESDQVMDEQDSPISAKDIKKLSEIPAYNKFLNMMIKKHYGEHL